MTSDVKRPSQTPIDPYLYLAGGGLLGLILLLHPFVFVSWWWNPLIEALREDQRSGVWKPAVVLFSMLAGLALMFACMQPARAFARIDPLLRRVVYGYNAVLTGILVLLILILVNVGIHVWAPRYLDATEGGFHSISDVTRTFVTDLDRRTQVYVVLPQGYDFQRNMVTLLNQLHELNPNNFNFEEVSPYNNDVRIRGLNKQFPQFTGSGVIVAMGDQPEKNYSVIPPTELENQDVDPRTNQPRSREFAGEVRLMQELNQLSMNKKKPVIYFTQGHAEPDLAGPREDGMSALQLKLMREGYDIRALKFPAAADPNENKVPDDADAVVVVGPQNSMADSIPALKAYLQSPRGRMIVFLGPTPPDKSKKNEMTETGIEKVLADFNVDLTNEQILTFMIPEGGGFVLDSSPDVVSLRPETKALDSRHPIAVTFKVWELRWPYCRLVRPTTKNPKLTAEALMGSYGYVWTESDLEKKPLDQHRLMQGNRAEFKKRCTPEPLPVVVAVSETAPSPTNPAGVKKPKLLVYGSSEFLTNQFQSGQSGIVNTDLTRSSIDWCRERYSSIGIQPKTYSSFIPGNLKFPKLVFVPAALMLMTILGFGLVIWNARRR